MPVDKFFYSVSVFPIFLINAGTPQASSDHLWDRKKRSAPGALRLSAPRTYTKTIAGMVRNSSTFTIAPARGVNQYGAAGHSCYSHHKCGDWKCEAG